MQDCRDVGGNVGAFGLTKVGDVTFSHSGRMDW